MKHHHLQNALLGAVLGVAVAAVPAAEPTVTLIQAEQVRLGEPIALRAEVADADANLQTLSFYASGPGLAGEQLLGTHAVSGAAAGIDRVWTPNQLGVFTVRVAVGDTLAGVGTASRTTQVFAERREVAARIMTAASGPQVVAADGEIRTKVNTAATEVAAESGSDVVFWARSRVVLKPGFRAKSGGRFWAALDSDMDGYSDMEEVTDRDGDGLSDAWERDQGNRPKYATGASTAATQTTTGGYTNGNLGSSNLPPNYQLVLRTPGNRYAGVQTSNNWRISTLSINP